MIKSNYHVHSTFCDGKNTVAEMAQAAKGAGITSLGFTSHAPLPYDNDWTMRPENVQSYLGEVARIKAACQGQMAVYTGLEIDYFIETGDISPLVKEIRPQLDFCIGSIHVMGVLPDGSHADIDYTPEIFAQGLSEIYGGSAQKFVETYYENLGEMALKVRPDIVGHMDLIKKNNADNCFFDEDAGWYKKAAGACLEAIRDSGCIVEVNTGGMARYGERCLYPSDWLLTQIKAMGIPIVLNGDSHSVDAIDYAYGPVLKKLSALGFTELMYFDGRDWLPQPLEL
ncbi:MAG: histidinol-phosphatase [Eubacterium sp.]|nr:histidinol-phosphatase [Eubacterium sp.]